MWRWFSLCLLGLPAQAQQLGQTWDWQLSATDLNRDVQVLDLDPDAVTAADIAVLKARGVFTICYVSVGTLEDWRGDVAAFPPAIVGREYGDWPGEYFLDIRALDTLLPLMRARFQTCADLGFDAIEPDNMDVADNDSGFDLTQDDAVGYILALADMAHAMGMRIGQKNVPELTAVLEPHLDFVITEGCIADGWCAQVGAFPQHGKPVFAAEYDVPLADRQRYCKVAVDLGMSLIFKNLALDATLQTCIAH